MVQTNEENAVKVLSVCRDVGFDVMNESAVETAASAAVATAEVHEGHESVDK